MQPTDLLQLNRQLRDELDADDWAYEVCEPCQEGDIEILEARAIAELGVHLPRLYLKLIRLSDGFACNGGTIYSSSQRARKVWSGDLEEPPDGTSRPRTGIVEKSLFVRESDPNLQSSVVLGHSELEYFVWRPFEEEYQFLSRCSHRVWDRFATLDELLRQKLPPVLFTFLG